MVWEQSPPTQTPSKQFYYSFLAKRRQIQTYSLHVICLATPVLVVFVALSMGSPLCFWAVGSRIQDYGKEMMLPKLSEQGWGTPGLLVNSSAVSEQGQPAQQAQHSQGRADTASVSF